MESDIFKYKIENILDGASEIEHAQSSMEQLYCECKQTLESIVEHYRLLRRQDLSNRMDMIVNWQYSRGGLGMHRGYFCPSIIDEIITGNISSGRLLKRKPLTIPDYSYGFDAEGKLILVVQRDGFEIVDYQGEIEIGVSFSSNMEIEAVSRCVYQENQLASYMIGYLNHGCDELILQRYSYGCNTMPVDWIRFFTVRRKLISEYEKYIFHIDNGCIYSFDMANQFLGNLPVSSVEPQTFHVCPPKRIKKSGLL